MRASFCGWALGRAGFNRLINQYLKDSTRRSFRKSTGKHFVAKASGESRFRDVRSGKEPEVPPGASLTRAGPHPRRPRTAGGAAGGRRFPTSGCGGRGEGGKRWRSGLGHPSPVPEAPGGVPQALVGDLVVDLGRRRVRVPKEALGLLDAEPHRGHLLAGGVAQVVKRDPLGNRDPPGRRVALEDFFDARVVEAGAARLKREPEEEGGRRRRGADGEPSQEPLARIGGEREHLLLVSLAQDHDRRPFRVREVRSEERRVGKSGIAR